MVSFLSSLFPDRMQQLGQGFPESLTALHAPPPVSVRLHPLKRISWVEITGEVKWYAGGTFLGERPVFTLDPAFHAGAYYPQEAYSMLVGAALQQLMPSGPLLALDLAAAPGEKAPCWPEWLPPGSLLVANEVICSRYQVLRHNLLKWGYPAVVTSNYDPSDDKPHTGWGLAAYSRFSMGWFKGRPNRINNYYPTAWRIRMALP